MYIGVEDKKRRVQFNVFLCWPSPDLPPPDLEEKLGAEFMSCGSVYDYIHKQKAVLKLPMLLRVAIDVSKGMDYLHQSNIIHRDLKAANLLMDENEVTDNCFITLRSDYLV